MDITILLGSKSDLPVAEKCTAVLKKLGIQYQLRVASAHRTPKFVESIIEQAIEDDCQIFIAMAGLAAALPVPWPHSPHALSSVFHAGGRSLRQPPVDRPAPTWHPRQRPWASIVVTMPVTCGSDPRAEGRVAAAIEEDRAAMKVRVHGMDEDVRGSGVRSSLELEAMIEGLDDRRHSDHRMLRRRGQHRCGGCASMAVGDRLHCVYVDTGLMRKHETDQIRAIFTDQDRTHGPACE